MGLWYSCLSLPMLCNSRDAFLVVYKKHSEEMGHEPHASPMLHSGVHTSIRPVLKMQTCSLLVSALDSAWASLEVWRSNC